MPALRLTGIRACVFDAYGTLFDVTSAAARAKDALGERWQPLSELWRAKQLQYTWLRSLMGRHVDFWQVTGDALDYAMASLAFQDTSRRAWRSSPGRSVSSRSNAWDAHAAKAFGYRVLWCNRFGQAPERIPERPDGEIATLTALPEIVAP